MKRFLLPLILLLAVSALALAQDEAAKVKVYGKVTDFEGTPVEGAQVIIMKKTFQPTYMTQTDAEGAYELVIEKGKCLAFITVKGYAEINLEYWAWNLIANADLEINARIDKLEVYAINAFKMQGAPGFFIFFRPMSLTKAKALGGDREELEKMTLADIAPALTVDDVCVNIDGEEVEVRGLTRITEATGEGRSMYAYIVQTSLPANWQTRDVLRICVTLTDSENGDKGEGCLFWEVPKY